MKAGAASEVPWTPLDTHLGPIQACRELPLVIPVPGLHTWSAYFSPRLALTGGWQIDKPTLGHAESAEEARRIARIEAYERIANGTFNASSMTDACAIDLGDEALNLALLPVCSEAEMASSPVRRPEINRPIRWAWARELTRGGDVLVPAVAVYLGLPKRASENFWVPISTGTAAHTCVSSAVLAGLCEVIERDALQVVWEHRLPLPRLGPSQASARAQRWIEVYERAGYRVLLFDATTEFGMPVALTLMTNDFNERAGQFLGTGSAPRMADALDKALGEMLVSNTYLQRDRRRNHSDLENSTSLGDGVTLAALRRHRSAFDFLVESPNEAPARSDFSEDDHPEHVLRKLLDVFRHHDMPVYSVDLACRETEQVGITVHHVLVPGLQPMAPFVQCRYRGHPRLYEAPAIWGYSSRPESDLSVLATPYG